MKVFYNYGYLEQNKTYFEVNYYERKKLFIFKNAVHVDR